MTDRHIAHYRILEELGRGGMGVVYRAEDTRLGRMVALKFMSDQLAADERSADRFLQEARAAAALSHPNIATLYGIEDVDGRRFITMEYVEGRSLTDVIADGPLSADRALDYATQMARGLERAHEAGIVHRDIKPANIRVTSRDEVKILDFGLAKMAGAQDLSQAGTTVGTAAYMSPQQVLGEDVDGTSDLWSLGVVLYEMLTGRGPFAEQYVHALYYQILNGTAPAVSTIRSDIDPALDGIVERLLAKESRHRYPTAGELIDDLTRIRAGTPESPAPMASPEEADGIRSAVEDTAVRNRIERERRQMTIVYCEVAGYGDLAESMDPEDVGEASAWLQATCRASIERFGGHPEADAGGGVFGYFGYPTAREDDPANAVRAGLDILSARGPGRGDVHVAVQTGVCIVREQVGGIQVQGPAADLTARLAGSADPNEVVVDKVTERLCRSAFDLRSLGLREVRGYSEPQPVFAVSGPARPRDAREESAGGSDRSMVGRDIELGLLRQRWNAARSGSGQIVLVSGEPGIGKSRLVDAFLAEALGDDAVWTVRLTCRALDSASALRPVTTAVRDLVRNGTEAPPDAASLRAFLRKSGLTGGEDMALVADLLGVPVPDDVPRSKASPPARRARLLQVLLQALVFRNPDRPGLIVIDDLHWADPSTAEWTDLLVEESTGVRVMALVTTRPPTRPAWLARTHATEITLGKLTRDDLVTIARRRSGGRELPPEIIRHIAERTDGVPLFAEELTTTILESGLLEDLGDRYELGGPLPEHLIPTTLNGSLMARLDQQGPDRHVAQIGSVVGREFAFPLLRAVAEADPAALETALARLVDAELMLRRGFVPSATFQFKHALVRDAAYNSLLRRQRREIHARVARVLQEESFDTTPEVVARHFSEAGQATSAIPLWIEAGRTAMTRNANREAVDHLRAGLADLEAVPDGPERDAMEVGLLSLLGPAVMMTRGYADPEGERIFLRVQEICHRTEALQPLFFSLYGLVSVYLIRGEYDRSFEILERSLDTAEQVGEDRYILMSHNASGVAKMFAGRPRESLRHLDAVLRLHDLERDDDLGMLGWGHLDVSASTSRQLALQLLGRFDDAAAQARATLDLAEGRSNHMTIYHARLYAGLLHLMRRDWAACRDVMRAYLPLAVEYGDPFYIAISSVVLNLAHREPDQEETFRRAEAILSGMREGGFCLGLSFLLSVMADGYLAFGDSDSAGRAIDAALAHLEPRRGEFWEADVYRMKGELLRAAGADAADVSPWFDRARDTARAQGAKSLELRAWTSIARLQPTTEAHADLRALLAELDGAGDLPDLRDAHAALEGSDSV